MKKYLYLIILLATVLGCGQQKVEKPNNTIYVSIEPLRFFAQQIAGDKFEVKTLVYPGSSPETFEPSAEQIAELSKSCMFIKVGNLGFEQTWLKRIIKNAPHTIFHSASEGIEEITSENGIPDPHTWMSTTNATIIAKNLCQYMTSIDKEDSLYFRKNLETLLSKIEVLDARIRTNLESYKSRSFIIYHPALSYFARDFMLQQIPIEEEGREPSVAQLQDVIAKGKELGIKIVLVQKEFSTSNAEVVANGLNAEIMSIDPLAYRWDKEIVKIAEILR